MYIAPNSVIRVLRNCPLDNTYDHTIFFSSASDQSSYFIGLTKYTFSNQTYQRVQRNKMRVARKADDLYDCNYIMFQNTSYGAKWFYGFITSVEYINNETSEITFEIDVMQTWFFDYSLGECLIDREHSSTDNVGDNTVPENLEHGDYISSGFEGLQLGQTSIVVAATFNESYEDVGGTIYGGIYSGLYFNVFPDTTDGAIACTDFIRNAGSKTDGIVAVFLAPTKFVTGVLDPVAAYSKSISKFTGLTRSDGVAIKNKKVLTYPYNFLYVTNLQGNSAIYHYEYFQDDVCNFTYSGDFSCNPQVVLCPNNYKGVVANYDEKITLAGYPQLAFTTDSFKAWLAQSASSLGINALSTTVQTTGTLSYAANSAALARAGTLAAGASAIAAPLAIAGAAVTATGLLASVVQHSFMPDQSRGGGSPTTLAAIGILDFAFMQKHIRPEFVTIIDDFFNMFGYATHKVKVPNRSVRPHWTFTKTINCVVHGSVPADDMKAICQIYNNGITFWKNGSEIGDYSLNNSV